MALAEYLRQLQQQKAMHAAGADMLEVVKQGGLPALNAQTLADIAQKHSLAIDGLQSTLDLLQKSGAAQKALQEYQTEIQSTRKEGNQADYAAAQADGQRLENTTIIPKAQAVIEKDNADARLSNVKADDILALRPWQIKKLQAEIGTESTQQLLLRAQRDRVVALVPSERAALDALTGQRQAATAYNQSLATDRIISTAKNATGVEVNPMGDNNEPQTYKGEQLRNIVKTFNMVGAGGFVVVTKRDNNGNPLEGYVSGVVPMTGGRRQTTTWDDQPQPKAGSGSGGGKALDRSTAAQILQEAGGDKAKARQIAAQRGYSF